MIITSNDKGVDLFTWREHLTFGEQHAVSAVTLMEMCSCSQSDLRWCPLRYSGRRCGFAFTYQIVSYSRFFFFTRADVTSNDWQVQDLYLLPLSDAQLDWRGENPKWSHWGWGKVCWFTDSLLNVTAAFCSFYHDEDPSPSRYARGIRWSIICKQHVYLVFPRPKLFSSRGHIIDYLILSLDIYRHLFM